MSSLFPIQAGPPKDECGRPCTGSELADTHAPAADPVINTKIGAGPTCVKTGPWLFRSVTFLLDAGVVLGGERWPHGIQN